MSLYALLTFSASSGNARKSKDGKIRMVKLSLEIPRNSDKLQEKNCSVKNVSSRYTPRAKHQSK